MTYLEIRRLSSLGYFEQRFGRFPTKELMPEARRRGTLFTNFRQGVFSETQLPISSFLGNSVLFRGFSPFVFALLLSPSALQRRSSSEGDPVSRPEIAALLGIEADSY
jgi:hypothetical protein